MLWPLSHDRTEQFYRVLYSLRPLEQAAVAWRLGPQRIFNPRHCSLHWVLDVANPGHEEVAKKLVAMAVASGPDTPNVWNLRLRGGLLSPAAGGGGDSREG